jgi:hypothetical protein
MIKFYSVPSYRTLLSIDHSDIFLLLKGPSKMNLVHVKLTAEHLLKCLDQISGAV